MKPGSLKAIGLGCYKAWKLEGLKRFLFPFIASSLPAYQPPGFIAS